MNRRTGEIAPSAIAITVAAMFVIGTVLAYIWAPRHIGQYDEGLVLTGAMRILAGNRPSVDFYTNYGPAQFYIIAGLIELVGHSVNVGRAYAAGVTGATVAISFVILTECRLLRSVGDLRALLPPIIIFLLLVAYGSPLYPVHTAAALILVLCWLMTTLLGALGQMSGVLWIALIVAAVSLLRLDMGILTGALATAATLVMCGTQIIIGRIGLRPALGRMLPVVAGVSGGLAIAVTILATAGILHPMLDQIIDYNTANYAKMRRLPFPVIDGFDFRGRLYVLVFFPIFAWLAALAVLWARRRDLATGDRTCVATVSVLCASVFTYSHALVRTDEVHAVTTCIFAVLVMALLVPPYRKTPAAPRWKRLLAQTAVVLGIAGVVAPAALVVANRLYQSQVAHGRSLGSSTHGKFLSPPPAAGEFYPAPHVAEAVTFVRSITRPDEQILSGVGRHDRIFINDNSFYFLANRLPGTFWHHYDPGLQTTRNIQRNMISELHANDVRVVVLDTRWDAVVEPNDSALSSEVRLLDNYIRANYELVRSFGPIRVFCRLPKNLGCAAREASE